MKSVIILRGVSGCGKSSFADSIKTKDSVVCCADDFFMVNGEYMFDPTKLSQAHQNCQKKFVDSCKNNVSQIIVANTNTSEKEFSFYEETAVKFGYIVFFVVIENRHGNIDIHGVPFEVRKNQCNRLVSSIKLM